METNLAALLCSCDPQSLAIAKRTFYQHGIRTSTCRTTAIAIETLKLKRFDLFALDFDLRGIECLLDLHTAGTVNAPRVTIGFSENPGALPELLRKRIRHLLQKPFPASMMAHTLKATYGLIIMEKRTSFRYAVRIDALAAYQDSTIKQSLQNASVLDVSQTGLCLRTQTTLPKNATTFVDFQLPETRTPLHVVGQVMWSDEKGRSGIQFRTISPQDLRTLRDWLNARCPWINDLSPRASAPPTVILTQSEKTVETEHAIRR